MVGTAQTDATDLRQILSKMHYIQRGRDQQMGKEISTMNCTPELLDYAVIFRKSVAFSFYLRNYFNY